MCFASGKRSIFRWKKNLIHYDIDITENEYCKLEGDVESLMELKQILFKGDGVPDLVGYLSFYKLLKSRIEAVMRKYGIGGVAAWIRKIPQKRRFPSVRMFGKHTAGS